MGQWTEGSMNTAYLWKFWIETTHRNDIQHKALNRTLKQALFSSEIIIYLFLVRAKVWKYYFRVKERTIDADQLRASNEN
jgi:hypothetical protein